MSGSKFYRFIGRFHFLLLFIVITSQFSGCERHTPSHSLKVSSVPVTSSSQKHFIFAVHPLYNPQLLHKKYQPLMAYLNKQIPGTDFELDTSSDYTNFENKLRQKTPDFALPNPYHAVLGKQFGYHVIAKMANDDAFRGIFIIRKDSPIQHPSDLKGKTISYPAPSALAATMMPQLYLQTHGIDVETELTNHFVGTHNSSIMNAYLKQSDASATWPAAWEAFQKANPKESAELKVIWETPTLIQNAVIARQDISSDIVNQVRQVLINLNNNAEGRVLLGNIDTDGFVSSDDQQFQVVETFLAEYRTKVQKKIK